MQIFATDTLLERLDSLESENVALEGELAYHKSKIHSVGKGEILYCLGKYLEPKDGDWEAYKREIIDGFIKEVYLFDDHFLVNYTIDGMDEVSLQDIENGGGFVFDGAPSNSITEKLTIRYPY